MIKTVICHPLNRNLTLFLAIEDGEEPISKDFEAQAEISGIRSGQMSTEIHNINNKSPKKRSNKQQIEELNDKLLK